MPFADLQEGLKTYDELIDPHSIDIFMNGARREICFMWVLGCLRNLKIAYQLVSTKLIQERGL